MPPPIKRPKNFKAFMESIRAHQALFKRVVRKAEAGAYFPEVETDKGRELDHHTLGVLEVYAWLSLQNHFPNEFERIAACKVCRYRNVDELNYQVSCNEVDTQTLCDLYPMFTVDELRVHVNVCLSRVAKAAAAVLPTPHEEKQVKRFQDRILSLDDEARELQRAAMEAGEFKAASDTLRTRHDIITTHGKATGEYQDAKVGVTVNNNSVSLIKAIAMPKHKPEFLLPPPDVIDVEVVDEE